MGDDMRLSLLILLALTASADDLRFASSPSVTMTTDDQIALYQKWAKGDPVNIQTQTLLAGAYIQKTRETADPGYLERSNALVARVLERQPRNYEAWSLRNIIELNRHHFSIVADYAGQLTTRAPDRK